MESILAEVDGWVMGAAGTLIGGTLVSVAKSVRKLVVDAGDYFERNRAELEIAKAHREREARHWETEEAILRTALARGTGPQGIVTDPVADRSTPIEGVP